MSLHHTQDAVCPLCEDKKKNAHPKLQAWWESVKNAFPDAHIAWSYRDKLSQEQAVAEHKSKLHYPKSAHNQTEDGKPCATALDLFRLTTDGKACFQKPWYEEIHEFNVKSQAPVFWGAIWKSLGDFDHFQLKLES